MYGAPVGIFTARFGNQYAIGTAHGEGQLAWNMRARGTDTTSVRPGGRRRLHKHARKRLAKNETLAWHKIVLELAPGGGAIQPNTAHKAM